MRNHRITGLGYDALGRAIHGRGPRRNGILDNDRRTGR